MKNLTVEFLLSAVSKESFPKFDYPEAAFIGRSNVGKSSLINSIVNQKNLAKISSTPGKTRQINFFLVDSSWSFADLPGFGYAATSKTEREKWMNLNFSYLSDRKNLKIVVLLCDIRHEPLAQDLSLMEWLENNKKNFVVVLTKSDKVSKIIIEERKAQFEYVLKNCGHCSEVFPYSSKTGENRMRLLAILKKNFSNKI